MYVFTRLNSVKISLSLYILFLVITQLKLGWNLTKHISNICENLFFDYLVKISLSLPVQTELNWDFANLLSKNLG